MLNPRRFSIQRRTGASAVIASIAALTPLPAWASPWIASLPPAAGLARDLQPKAEIACLLPAGADPHRFALRPSDRTRLTQATLLIRAGIDDQSWPWPARLPRTTALWPARHHGWLDPQGVARAIDRLAPAIHASSAQIRSAKQSFDMLTAAWRQALAPLRESGVILQHPAWKPLFEAAGVPVRLTLESGHHEASPGPRRLEAALALIRTYPGIWLVGEASHDNRALDWLARHADAPARRIDLDAIGRCGEPLSALWRRNLQRFQRATQGASRR